MTLQQFQALSFEEQLSRCKNSGTFLLSRPVEQLHLCLYAVDSFFVEIHYSTLKNSFQGCYPFSNLERLNPYLLLIELEVHLPN